MLSLSARDHEPHVYDDDPAKVADEVCVANNVANVFRSLTFVKVRRDWNPL